MKSKSSRFLFLLSLAFFSLASRAPVSIASDTLSPGQSLSRKQTIISQDGKFELGFFRSGNSTSQNYYIGIWYKKIWGQTVVWVANRDKPLSNTSSVLKLSEDGNLVLFSQSRIPIWSSNSPSRGSNSTVAVLLDTGNLVLRDGSNSSNVFWQSFEHPTDTWLPGGRLGLNKVTGENQVLYSWRNSEDPARGIFSLEMDPNGSSQYYILWNRSVRYWTSGVWNGQTFSLVPEMTANYIYNFSFVSNEKESYFTYTAINSSLVSRFVMDVSGQIQQLTWLESSQQWILLWSRPSDRCEAYSLCGAFSFCSQIALPFCKCLQGFTPLSPSDWNLSDWSAGCSRKNPLQCEKNGPVAGEKDKFFMMRAVHFPPNSQYLPAGSVEECESGCLNNCSCSAYAYGSQCSVWYGDLLDLKHLSVDVGDGSALYIRLASSEFPNSSRKNPVATKILVVAGVVSVLGMVLVLLLWYRRRKMIAASKRIQGLVTFSYRDLQSATKNFSEKLGTGGFGSVYRGILPDSTAIAVKKLEGFRQGEKQFRAELRTIGTIQHVNLIHLRGFCSERSKKLLVYDYMPNGSLDFHLFGKNDVEILDWRTRYQIAIGTARGLAYLHEECRDCIIHCDIKPENILLDDEFCPKVADFGLSKLVGREFSRVLTTIRGTRGYLAPEWISGHAITPKADTYSFGMMLFEVISGRRNSEESRDGKIVFFPTWAAKRIAESEVIGLLDPRLNGNANMEELKRASKVACWCIQDDENHRPSMGQVVQILEGLLDVGIPPLPRTLQILAENDQDPVEFSLESSSDRTSQRRDKLSTSSQTTSMSPTIFSSN